MLRRVLPLIIFLQFFCTLQALELKRVILATNNDPTYIQFWQIAAPLWKKMGLTPTLALIADETCKIDETLGEVIRFDPLPGVPESLHAQTIRLLLPALFPDDDCLISDIDMLPISRSYYIDGAKECPDDHFLIYRDKAYTSDEKKYPMCYVAAKGKIFQDLFKVSTPHQIQRLIQNWAKLGLGWNTDELMLYDKVQAWEKAGGKVFRLHHGIPPRIDRMIWVWQTTKLEVGEYVECHCPRPYSAYKQSIDKVVAEIYALWDRQDQGT